MKVCRVCGVELTDDNSYPSSFLRHDYICKKCNNERAKKWASENPEKIKKSQRKYRAANLKKVRTWRVKGMRKWRAKNPEKVKEYVKRQKKKFPEKFKARSKAQYHISLGEVCEDCGSTENLGRHHDDYSKPLEVKILCGGCDLKRHRLLKVIA